MSPEVLVAVLAAILLGSAISRRLRLPAPVVLVAVGSLLTLVPHLGGVGLPPEAVLLIFLPVLLYWESLTTSLREIRVQLRGVVLTGTLLVVFTAAVVAAVLHLLGLDWGPAWIIGAALGPTDATAVAALGRGMARRGRVVLQAESLINDGTALVVYALALGMATGQLEPTLGTAAERFAVSFGGGIVVGLVVGWAMFWVRRGLSDPLLMNVGSVLTPFAAYLLAEAVHASGVLAVVVSGLYMARVAPRTVPGSARQQGAAFWTLTTFVLNGALFVLVGMQLPSSVVGLTTDTVAHALLLVAAAYVAMVVARYVFLNVSIGIIRLLDRRPKQRLLRTTHRGRIVSTLAGFRGAVSLAVALSVPETLASRDVIVFITGTVVVVSLVIQGFLLPRAIPWARLPADTSVSDELRIARVTATEEALDALPELARARGVPDEIVERFQGEYGEKLDALRSDEADAPAAARLEAQRDLALALIAQKRATVVRLRDEGTIDDTVLRQIQAQLDAEEIRLVGPATEE